MQISVYPFQRHFRKNLALFYAKSLQSHKFIQINLHISKIFTNFAPCKTQRRLIVSDDEQNRRPSHLPPDASCLDG